MVASVACPNTMASSTEIANVILFGAQSTRFSREQLSRLRDSTKQDADLHHLRDVIKNLPSIWPDIVKACPSFTRIPAADALANLHQVIQDGALPSNIESKNMLFVPLTVISQLVDFWSGQKTASQKFSKMNSLESELSDVQGFCIGFLAAIVVACSKDVADFQRLSSIVLHLAVCIGAAVDLDEAYASDPLERFVSFAVRYESIDEQQQLEQTLRKYPEAYLSCITDKRGATVTIRSGDTDSFTQEMMTTGVSMQPISLSGRYHHHDHEHVVTLLKNLCEADERFRLPTTDCLQLPLRSNSNADVITSGELHSIALDSILLEQALWYQTVESVIDRFSSTNTDVQMFTIGREAFMPTSLTGRTSSPCRPYSQSVNTESIQSSPNGITPGPSPTTNGICSPDVAMSPNTSVAIVGMACRYPDADSIEEFWNLIQSGGSAVQELPESRFNVSDLWREPRGQFWGNFLRHPDTFDHRFFGISGREAKSMDPQQRLLLEVAYEAMASSGYFSLGNGSQSKDIGCFVGVGSVDYADNISSHDPTAFSALGTLRAFITGRVSHFFGWTGPSITYDTACSSGAVAIHAACKALQTKECSVAVAGGVNVITSPGLFQNLAAAKFLSSTGASKAFDAKADGYCRGEGIGLVVLKSLADAVAGNDNILGVISGSAINQGANCTPITVPDQASQTSVYQKALSISGTNALDVSYVEAHGTGTPVGDPIELNSIRQTFGGSSRHEDLFVGSVKDNIGHTETASGAAGLLKVVLMMQKNIIPKQANFSRLNPDISSLGPDKIKIPVQSQSWKSKSPRRTAVINNYGAAGSNTAIVLQDFDQRADIGVDNHIPMSRTEGSEFPFFISAHSFDVISSYCSLLKDAIPKIQGSFAGDAVPSIAYNLATKQNQGLKYTLAFTAQDTSDLLGQLTLSDNRKLDIRKSDGERPVILCFGGQSGSSVCLSKELFDACTLLQTYLGECDSTCAEMGFPSIFPHIFSNTPSNDVVRLHCMLFSLQYACAKCWLDCGLKVSALVGHSFGQLTALCVAGSLCLSDALRLIGGRAKIMQLHWGPDTGAMVSVEGEWCVIRDLLDLVAEQCPSTTLDIACYNGPRNYVVSGSTTSIKAFEEAALEGLFSQQLRLKWLQNTHAYHSNLVDGIIPALTELAQTIQFKQPSIAIEACCRERLGAQFTAETIVQHSRYPVYFADAVQRISKQHPSSVWLEAGSGSSIIPMVRRALKGSNEDGDHHYQSLDIGNSDAQNNLSKATCCLWNIGIRAQHWQFHRVQKFSYQWIDLPPYQFQQQSHWLEYKPSVSVNSKSSCPSLAKEEGLLILLEQKCPTQEALFTINSDHISFKKCVEGHAVLGLSLCPASLYVELAISAAGILDKKHPSKTVPNIQRLEICAPLGSSPTGKLFLRLSKKDGQMEAWNFTLTSQKGQHGGDSVTHARGTVAALALEKCMTSSRLRSLNRLVGNARCEAVIQSPGTSSVSGSVIYQLFGRVVNYMDYYRGVQRVTAKDCEAIGIVSLPETNVAITTRGFSDPLLVDNCLQVAGIHVNILSDHADTEVYICTAVEEILFSPAYSQKNSSQQWTVYTVFGARAKGDIVSDIFVLDPDSGSIVLAITSAQFKSIPMKILAKILSRINDIASSGPQADIGIHHEQDNTLVKESKSFPKDDTSNCMQVLRPDPGDIVFRLQTLLSDVIGIPPEEAQPNSSLTDLGVDSLMATEVLVEIQKQFDVSLSASDLQQAGTLQGLVQHIQPSASDPGSSFDNPVRKTGELTQHNAFAEKFDAFTQIQAILSDIMDVPVNEITPRTTFVDIGVDSLVATELLGEIKTNFNVEVQPGEFQNLCDVQDLCKRVQPSELTAQPALPSNGTTVHKSTPSFASIAFEQVIILKREFDTLALEMGFTGFSQSVYPEQRELVVAYVVEAFTSLGCPLGSLASGQSVPAISVSSVHQKLEKQLYKILEDYGVISQTSEGTFRMATPVPTASAQDLHRNIVKHFPQHVSEHLLLHTTAPRLGECLIGKVDPLSLLFRDKKARLLLEDVYTNAPMFKTGTNLLAQYLTRCLEDFGGSRIIKIIELGAGTGGTTKHLIDTLVRSGQTFQYTFTDISSSMVAAAKRKFSQYDFMEYAVLDIEQVVPLDLQGHYDIVISTNCIHATSNLDVSTTNIRNLLGQDGILCLVELTRNLFWFDLVFGLLEGWWLFKDGRQHALTHEVLWEQCLRRSGFQFVDWSESTLPESEILRVIVATPSIELPSQSPLTTSAVKVDSIVHQETIMFKKTDGIELLADIYYPSEISNERKPCPVALMIHGGGHIMLSRKYIRPKQTEILLEKGFIPVSVDYRLCPETTLEKGPMQDVCSALHWARNTLPHLCLKRPDVSITGEKVVAVGWSTGGHLAMSLGWTAPNHGIQPPEAILAFYCPTDYEDPFWTRPNFPFGQKLAPEQSGYDLLEAVHDRPITEYSPGPAARALGGWMAPDDPRSRIALHMNWKADTLPILLHGLQKFHEGSIISSTPILPFPSLSQIQAVSPLSQISKGAYRTPTFIVHGTQDDLIPWEQAERTYRKLMEHGINTDLRLINDVVHLFDIYSSHESNAEAVQAVWDGYCFLQKHVGDDD